jgi:small subunit ribosomal protein S9
MADDETKQDETEQPEPKASAGDAEPEVPAEDAPEQEESGDAAEAEAPEVDSESEADAEKPKAKDAPPGAELDPIAIEPERELSAEERARAEAEAEERARLEAEATADAGEDEPVARSRPAVELPADARIQATGKRKSSIARVVLRPGKGSFEINSRSLEDYFPRHQHQALARQPLVTAGYEEAVDVRVRVRGGGISGQAGAVRHGVARALTEVDSELRGELKRRGLLTRDARAKERRKAGLKKARKRPQFSKR